MTDSQQHHITLSKLKLAGLRLQGASTGDADSVKETPPRSATTDCPEMDPESPEQAEALCSSMGGLVQEFEEAFGDFKQVLSPRGACTPDELATPSTVLDSSQTSPLCANSWRGRGRSTSPSVRVASPGSPRGAHVSLVTEDVLETRIEQLTLTMLRTIREEITSFDSTLQDSFDALEARCEALEKKDLERHEHDHRALADRVDGLQRQSAEQDQRVAQLGHTCGQALDSLRLLGPRLDKMSQDHQENVGALELANQQMVVRLETLQKQACMPHDSDEVQEQGLTVLDTLTCLTRHVDTELQRLDTEMQRLEGMLHGPAPSVESDLQNFFQEMEGFKDKLHSLSHAQTQDLNNGFKEVYQFQQELGQRVDDEMKLLTGKVDEVGKVCTDLENRQAQPNHAQNQDLKVYQLQNELGRRVDDEIQLLRGKVDEIFRMVQPSAPQPQEVADDDCRWELQIRALGMSN